MVIIKKLKLLTLLFLITASLHCSGGGGDSTGNNILYNQKIITNGDFLAESHWNDPHVLFRDGEFIMYASADISWEGVVKIYRLTSSDGKNWTMTNGGNPVLSPSVSGWDSQCTETPAVVYFGGQYHMFYTGYDVPYDYTAPDGDGGTDTIYDDDIASKHFRIGHATSPDGIIWTKDGANPIVSPTDPYAAPNLDFNQSVVGEPAPVVFNGKIYLYFTAVGAQMEVEATWQTIGLVTSADGTTWSSPQRVLTPDLTLYPRTTGDQYIGYSTPNAIVYDGEVHLFFDVVLNDPWTQVKIHHASSADGETGWTHDRAPLLERENYDWTAEEIRSPSALEYENSLYLYFAGHCYEGATPVLSIGLIIYGSY